MSMVPPHFPKIITASGLLEKEFPEPRWAVPGLIPDGITLLAGKPKMGKSWLALGIGVAVASGGYAMGKIKVEQGDCLYLSLEDNQRRLQSRLRKMLRDNPAPIGLHLCCEFPRIGDGAIEYIEYWIGSRTNASSTPRLVIIDTLQKVRKHDGSKLLYTADYELGEELHKLAHRHGIAILAVHHLKKDSSSNDPMDHISGSLGLTGSVDGSLVLTRQRGSRDAVLHITGRDIEDDEPLEIKWDALCGVWSIIGKAVLEANSVEQADILRQLQRFGRPASIKELADKMGSKQENLRQIMYRMVNKGDLIQINPGEGHAHLYEAP